MASEGFRVDALLFLRVLHVVRIIMLFILSIFSASSTSHYVFSIGAWYLFFFLADLPLLLAFLRMKSDWEMGARIFGLLWTILLILWLLLTSGYGLQSSVLPLSILWMVIAFEILVLVKPGAYRSSGGNSDGLSPID
ncbi:MAG: hypothetical protein ACW977_13990 [Candidatus Thorarchaeota archaeon]